MKESLDFIWKGRPNDLIANNVPSIIASILLSMFILIALFHRSVDDYFNYRKNKRLYRKQKKVNDSHRLLTCPYCWSGIALSFNSKDEFEKDDSIGGITKCYLCRGEIGYERNESVVKYIIPEPNLHRH